jgi:hypothetical protein
MKTPSPFSSLLIRSVRPFALSSLLGAASTLSLAATTSDDSAAQLLAKNGTVQVTSVGRFVEPGTFRIQVAQKLGRPDFTLADGTWIYHHRRVNGSDAAGTLVIRFNEGRVSSLSIATPAVVAALRNESAEKASKFVAAK